MSDVHTWDKVDSQNNDPPPDGAPEGQMQAKEYNDVMRAIMGAVARWLADIEGSLVSTGTEPAYIVTTEQTYTSYYDGMSVSFRAHATNTDATQVNVDGVGLVDLVGAGGNALSPGGIVEDVVYTITYFQASNHFRLRDRFATDVQALGARDVNALAKWIADGTLQSTGVLVDDDDNLSGHGTEINPEALSRTLTQADNGRTLRVDTSGGDVTLTLPEEATEVLTEGFQCLVLREGANNVLFAVEGTDTLESADGNTAITTDFAAAAVIKVKAGAPAIWWLGGTIGTP